MTDALNEKAKEEYSKLIPLGRFGTTEEIASLTSFLLSKASSYITGEVIKIDGGMYI
jgi:3-oxoacyl-[acyl-carrier protein] reductase